VVSVRAPSPLLADCASFDYSATRLFVRLDVAGHNGVVILPSTGGELQRFSGRER
jgi:hypothetical protein